ncbi:MAG: site-specific DNA-methyltransferase [Xanthobacteraceae bacterium]
MASERHRRCINKTSVKASTVRSNVSKAAPGGHRAIGANLPWPIEMLSPRKLRASQRNVRTHSKKQIQQIAKSIESFGFVNPIVADNRGTVVCGHARVEAANLLALKSVPVIRVSHLNDAEIRAFMLADNKLAENAGWDREGLAAELGELQVVLPEVELDLSITGFATSEIDSVLGDFNDNRSDPADEVPELEDVKVSQKNDLFVLGKHRIIVGDARDARTLDRLMQGNQATMAFLDPPYNVKINGHVGGRGRTKHREFELASGEMTPQRFITFLQDSMTQCARHTVDGGITYVCMDWKHSQELLTAGLAVYDELKNICVWVKTNAGQGTFYRSQHELVFVFKSGKSPHINTFELGQHGRTRTNVWVYAGVNSFRAGRMDDLRMHPTVKPTALITDAMKDCSRRGSIVLDAFAGSGTSIAAAEQVGRHACCVEIDPRYVDTAIRRWQRLTGKDAVLESTGQTFDELASARNRKA